jgi:1-acyl-sn-glycerol-3-phosphate acyltransferase
LIVFLSLIMATGVMLAVPFSRLRGPTAVMRCWARCFLAFVGIRVRVRGAENIDAERHAVYMANHESIVDIPALIYALPLDLRFIYKKSINYIPLVGQAVQMMKMVPIDRSDRARAIKSLARAGQLVREGVRLVVFPEGTRSDAGQLIRFKKGGFIMAQTEGLMITPISINNSQNLMGRNSLLGVKGVIDIVIHPPVPAGDFDLDRRDELIETVRRTIASGMPASGACLTDDSRESSPAPQPTDALEG